MALLWQDGPGDGDRSAWAKLPRVGAASSAASSSVDVGLTQHSPMAGGAIMRPRHPRQPGRDFAMLFVKGAS